jgi:hypothetical protein
MIGGVMGSHQFPMFRTSKPFLRWWWFSGSLAYSDIDEQLDWVQKKGFGGVEIAWVFPLSPAKADEGPQFLDDVWLSYVLYAQQACKDRNLGCDVTFGTLWPFGGTFLPVEYSSRTFQGVSRQRLERSWESRYCKTPGRILNHLDTPSFSFYSDYLLSHGFKALAEASPMSFFSDSWEVETDGLSYDGLFVDFSKKFGYNLVPYVENLDLNQEVRFDYRQCIADRILEHFFKPYVAMCKEHGSLARMQCHGAPTDILAAYALVDIPESETMLFDPDFALIAASAAAIWDKPLVSSETFSCLYGWVPNTELPPGIGAEKIEDLKCVVDAQFAWGVNRVVWHGMPYSTKEKPNRFYATVHLGPDGLLDQSLLLFNSYLETIGRYLEKGKTYSKMAVYLPLEDQWMLDVLPQDLIKPSSHYYWELQEMHMSDALLAYRPLWFSGKWLEDLCFDGTSLICGNQTFEVFYSDAEWMSFEHLEKLENLLRKGAPIHFDRFPKEPGLIKHPGYNLLLESIKLYRKDCLGDVQPILESEVVLDFWCRSEGDKFYLFISNPAMRKLRYPLPSKYGSTCKDTAVTVMFNSLKHSYRLPLSFVKCESVLYVIDDAKEKAELLAINWQ